MWYDVISMSFFSRVLVRQHKAQMRRKCQQIQEALVRCVCVHCTRYKITCIVTCELLHLHVGTRFEDFGRVGRQGQLE